MGSDRFEDIWRGTPRSETIDLRGTSPFVLTVPLSRSPDARWIHLFRMAIGVDCAIGTKAPPVVGDSVILETVETDVGRSLRVLDERIQAANRAYRLNRSVDLVAEEAVAPSATPAADVDLDADGEQLAVLDRLLGE